MTPEQQRRALDLFDAWVDIPTEEQARRLAELEAAEPELARTLRSLLAADAATGSVLERPAAGYAAAELLQTQASEGGRIGDFELRSLLGRGGMGEVWLAERQQDGFTQRVALKLLRPGLDEADLVRRFVQERRMLAELNHPQIARFIDGGTFGGRPWYAMDYVPGVPLGQYLRERAPDLRARVALLAEVAEIVAHAQARLIVHRDLKPSNVLIDEHERPFLLDFGIAKWIGEAAANGGETASGVHAMSPAYAAPEQVLGQPISTATDVYSLGLMLYEAWTGELPHQRRMDSLAALVESVRQEQFELASQRLQRSGLGSAPDADELDMIVLMALRSEPERRYRGAAEFADDLRRWLGGLPVRAQSDTRTYRLRKFVARHRLAVGSASAVLLALIAGLALSLWQAGVAREQARLAEAARVQAETERGRAEREAEKSNRIAEFLASLLSAADPFERESTTVPTVTDLVARAAARVERDLAGQPELQAAILSELSSTAFNSNDIDTGVSHAERAGALLQPIAAPDPVVAASVARVRGEALIRGGKPDEAEAVLRQGLASLQPVMEAAAPSRNARLAAAHLYNGLGIALFIQTRQAEAAEALERNLALFSELYGAESPQAGLGAQNLATLYYSSSQLALAQDKMRLSLAIHRKHLAADDPRLAIVLGLKAQIDSDLGHTREAIASAREALAIAEKTHAADSIEVATPLSTLGEVYLMAGDFDAALPLLQRAVESARLHDRAQLEFSTARSLALLELYREQPHAALPWLEMARAAAQRRTGGKGVWPLTIAGMHWWARGLAGELEAARAGITELREPIIAISGAESVDEMVRRYYAGELAHRAGDHAGAIVELREALRIGAAVPEMAQSSFAHQSQIVLGASLLALAPEDAEGRRLIEAGIAGLNAKVMGWHPWVRRGRGLLPAAG